MNARPTSPKLLVAAALAIFEAALPPPHPKLTACRENYEWLLREMHHYT